MKTQLSVVINAHNVESELGRALTSIKDLADEIVVIDQDSNDNTAKIAKKFKAKIFAHPHVPYVELARNFAIDKASCGWILVLDPDEEVGTALAKKIKSLIINKPEVNFYRIPRKNIVFGKWLKYSRWWPDYNVRLFKKGSVSWTEEIHKVPITYGKGQDLDAIEEFSIIHHHYDSIEQFILRMNRYTASQAAIKKSQGYAFAWNDLITKPANEFFSRFFYGRGYKDGIHGLGLSLLQAFSELVLYLKLWEMEKFNDQQIKLSETINILGKTERDLHFWENDALYFETKSLSARIKRKLRI